MIRIIIVIIILIINDKFNYGRENKNEEKIGSNNNKRGVGPN